MITETRRPTTPIKFPGSSQGFKSCVAASSCILTLLGESSVSYASFWMLRVDLCLCIRRTSFTYSLNVVSARPINVKQSIVYLRALVWFSSRCFSIYDDEETNAFRLVHLIACFCIRSMLLLNILIVYFDTCCLILLPYL